ncbi:MAG: thymidine kinase [Candidatus Uhrbacteria bacterium]
MPAELTVIAGCMFSGKSEELLRLLNRAAIAKLSTIVVKPSIDTRTMDTVQSRDGRRATATVVTRARDIIAATEKYDVIGIDEAQFFDGELPEIVLQLYARGKRVIVAGLDTDYRGEFFGPMYRIMALPEAEIVKLRAVCMRCGANATRTHRKNQNGEQIEVGDVDKYEALCYRCYTTTTTHRAAPVVVANVAAR